MPTSCSAPSCKSNYKHEDRVTIFKMPQKPEQLRHAWVQALRRDDIDELKAVYVCAKHLGKKTSSTQIEFPMETALFAKFQE